MYMQIAKVDDSFMKNTYENLFSYSFHDLKNP